MNAETIILGHIEGPDIRWIAEELDLRAIPHRLVLPVHGDPLPSDPGRVVVLGGPMSVHEHEDIPFLAAEITWLRALVDRGVPVLGLCLGAQLLAQALGGRAVPGSEGLEHGLIDVHTTDEDHPLTHALSGRFFSFHSDTYVAPRDAVVLAASDRYPQAWVKGSALAVQFHPEISADGVRQILSHEGPKLRASGIDTEAMLTDVVAAEPASRHAASALIGGWLDLPVPTPTPDPAPLRAPASSSDERRVPMSATSNFIARHGIYSDEQQAAASELLARIDELGLDAIRMTWPDQHGQLRGKSMSRDGFASALKGGIEITMAPFFFDSANGIVFNPFSPDGGFGVPELAGSPNVIMVPDIPTFRVLPWADGTGWVMCDIYSRDGSPFPFSPRSILKRTLAELRAEGYDLTTGLEIEWYLTRLLDDNLTHGSLGAPGTAADTPLVAPVARGYSYLLDDHLDEIDEQLRPIRRAVQALGLPLRSFDDEWAPSQVETTFDVLGGLDAADAVTLFRMAVKQVAKRNGHMASFMCTPAIAGFYASGWHLHSSLTDVSTGANAFVPQEGEVLSDVGMHYIGGTLEHGVAASVFTTPTVNGYRRRRPYSLAPDRVTWGSDNRAALMRVISNPGDPSSHVENRVGEPSANPYLYIAAQAAAGLDGLRHKTDPGPASQDPYASDAAQLPQSLSEAVDALDGDSFYRTTFGSSFVDYLVTMKRFEVGRYEQWLADNPDRDADVNGVTDWEHREYFEKF